MSIRIPRLPRRWQRGIAPAAVIALIVVFVAFRVASERVGGPRAGPAPRPVPVEATAARRGSVPVYVTGLGSVTALNTVAVKSRIDGQLMRVDFSEGQVVKQGDLLAEIDPRPAEAQLEQARGQLARDEALLANSRIDLERYSGLFAKDSIAKQQLDTQAALVRQYEGTVEVDRGAVDNAALQLDYCRITAPISGRLGLRLVDVGNIVHAADPAGLVVITQLQPISLVFSIPEDDLPPVLARLASGAPPVVEAFDRGQTRQLATGALQTVDNQIDPTTGTVRLKAQFANDDGALFPNQFVNARLLLELRSDATVVPAAAVQRGAQGAFAYVVRPDQSVEMRALQVGLVQGDSAAIDAGVTPGELVVVDGASALREGSVVDVKVAPATAAALSSP